LLSSWFSGLLDDPTFQGAVEEVGKEETPYFNQIPKDEEEEEGSLILHDVDKEGLKSSKDHVSLF